MNINYVLTYCNTDQWLYMTMIYVKWHAVYPIAAVAVWWIKEEYVMGI
jgi:hypothetical protein